MTKDEAIAYLRETLLDWAVCQFWACPGPRKKPVDMRTCHRCRALYDTNPRRIHKTKVTV